MPTTKTTTTRRKKSAKPVIDNTPYNNYHQCLHVFGVKVYHVCAELVDTIDKITGYWPLGERNDKLTAIRHVMEKTACFSRNLTMSVITGNREIPAEDRIDF